MSCPIKIIITIYIDRLSDNPCDLNFGLSSFYQYISIYEKNKIAIKMVECHFQLAAYLNDTLIDQYIDHIRTQTIFIQVKNYHCM